MLNNPRDERCTQDGWAVFGVSMKGLGRLRKEVKTPIGVYSSWRSARIEGDAWMATELTGIRYEIEQLYRDTVDAIDILTEGEGE